MAAVTLVIACVASWFVIVVCVISVFRIAARGDEVLPPAGWRVGASPGERAPQSDVPRRPLPLRRFSRRLYAVHRP